MKIGFIGTGVMGSGIIHNLLKNGHDVAVFTRTKSKADPLLEEGAQWASSPAELTQQVETVITMVGFPQDVEEVYFGDHGIFSTVTSGQILIDMTTSSPILAEKIGKKADELAVMALDAPVSGGDIGAQNATLTIMVGGNQTAFETMKPIFGQIGHATNYFGTYGAGQNAKMANQIMIAGTMTGLTEMLVYAKAAQLNLKTVLETLSNGGASNWSMENYVPRILKNDYTPGFFAKHFLKDLKIALDQAKQMQVDLPATCLATQLYDNLVNQQGLGDDGTQALIKLWWK
ncbi:NAD(P)-dependent oxidoreductase [Pediococcus pentosaceus]|uniref:NAD(P)-dependent oxidoreductase n=1 Tax=Pediococcus pentosaceus TaxID=1255 RepID=UPI00237F1DC4|nr:NAD(P)-dependent oxidoreductase [Pediococcus pentosaceus]MDE3750696.1 NAD(P)-dependent oxidoreductase [Pediococcus pentosaceus]